MSATGTGTELDDLGSLLPDSGEQQRAQRPPIRFGRVRLGICAMTGERWDATRAMQQPAKPTLATGPRRRAN
jgi:hypothetical protein